MIMMNLFGHIICLVGLVYLISAEADNVQPLHAQNEPVQAENTGQRGSKFEDGQNQQAGIDGRNEQVINDGQMEDENMINVKDIHNYQNDDSGEVVNEMKEMPDEENVAIPLDHNSEQRDQNNIDDGHHEGSDYNLDLQNDNNPINIDGQQGMGENENFDHGLAHGDTDSHKMTDKEKDLPITTENDEAESPQQHEERIGDLDHQPVYDDTIQRDQQHMNYEDQQQNSPEPNQHGEEQEDQQVHDSYAAKEDETRQYEEYPESQEEIYGEKQQGTQQQDLYEEQQEHSQNEQYEQYEEKNEEKKQYEQNDQLQTPNQPFDADQYHDDRASVDDAFQGDTNDVGDDFHHQADPAPNAEETPHVEEQYSEESHREQLILEPVIEDIPYDAKQEEQTQDTYYGEEIPVNDFGDASHEEHREYDTRDHVGDFEDHGSDAPQQEDLRMVDDEQYVEEFQPQTAHHPPDLVDPIPDEGPVEVEQILGEKYEDDGATNDQQFQEEVSDQHVYDNVEYIHKEPITGEEEFHQDPKEDEEHDAYRITEEEMEFEKKLKEQQSLEDEQEYQKETIQEDVEQEDSGTKENIKGNLQSQPNIVIFLASNVEVGDLGCYGNRTAGTPNIDSIAARGVLMSHHLTAGLTDTSSRAAFYTGRIPVRYGMSPTGVSDEIETVASKSGLPAEETTFAEILKSENYETALIGTWNLGMNCDSIEDRCHHPNMHGFGRFFGLPLLNKYSVPDSAPQNDYIKKPILIMVIVFFICIILRKVLGLAAVFVIIISCLAFGGWSYFCYKNPQIWSNILMRDGDVTEQPVDWETLTGRIVSEARKFLNSQNREQHQPKLLVVSFPHIYPYLDTSKEFRATTGFLIHRYSLHIEYY